MNLSPEQLKELCILTVELTRLRQDECKHLAIENVGPEIFGKLLREAHSSEELACYEPAIVRVKC